MKNQRGESIVSLGGRAKEGEITLLVGKTVDSKIVSTLMIHKNRSPRSKVIELK